MDHKQGSQSRRFWISRCSCGTAVSVEASALKSGNTQSCGCLQRELEAAGGPRRTHGKAGTPEYKAWIRMKNRCYDESFIEYAHYGGRGINVCDEWRHSFETFFADIGPRPSPVHSLDRINNDGNYGPGNVRWATRIQQANNRRCSRFIEFNGQRKTVAEWEQSYGFGRNKLYWKIANGISMETAILLLQIDQEQEAEDAAEPDMDAAAEIIEEMQDAGNQQERMDSHADPLEETGEFINKRNSRKKSAK